MKNHVLGSVCAAVIIGVSGAMLSGSVPASLSGPPLICQPFDVDGATTIGGGDGTMKKYDRKHLVRDTLDALNPNAATIVRMETLRRATVVASPEPAIARDLLLRLVARTLDAEASGKGSATAWFDAGYFAASLSQMGSEIGFDPGREAGCDGYGWLKKAAALEKNDAGIEFACALATHPAMHKGTQEIYGSHLVRAGSLAAGDPLVRKNLDSHCTNWNVKIDDLKKQERAKK